MPQAKIRVLSSVFGLNHPVGRVDLLRDAFRAKGVYVALDLDPRFQIPRPYERVEPSQKALPQGGVVETFAEVFAKTVHQRGDLRVSAQAHEQAALAELELSTEKRRSINEAIDRLQDAGKATALLIDSDHLLQVDAEQRLLLDVQRTSAPKQQVLEGLDAVVVL